MDWSILDLLDNVDTMWGMVHKALIYEIDEMCPYNFVKVRKFRPIWFTSAHALSEISRERDNLLINTVEVVEKKRMFI